jgi:hypothetical protein
LLPLGESDMERAAALNAKIMEYIGNVKAERPFVS